MIAFGIDPGSHRTGWGVVRAEGSRLIFVDAGVVRVDPAEPLPDRLAVIHAGLTGALEAYGPERVFVESLFHAKNAKSALVLGHARGVALLCASQRGLRVQEITPAEVKKAVTGRGRADKNQVQEMVRLVLGLAEKLPADASDALAVAIAGTARARWDRAAARGQLA